MRRVTMMTAGFALVTALAGCDVQGNVAGTRQAPMFIAGCDGELSRQWPEARNSAPQAPRWNNGSGYCAGAAGGDGQAVQTASTEKQVSPGTDEAASGGASGATDGGAVDRVETGTEEISRETSGGKGGTGGNGGDGGSGDAGTETGGAGGSGGAGTETGGAGGSGGDGGTGGAGTETGGDGGAGGSGGTGTETGGTGGSGGDGGSGGTGPETGDTGGDPVREHTGKPEDGVTGKPQEVGPPPSTGKESNAGGRNRN